MGLICSSFARVGEISNNIIDQLLFLQDVLNIQVPCVNDYLKDVLVKEFFTRYCYEVIQPDCNMVKMKKRKLSRSRWFSSERRCFCSAACWTPWKKYPLHWSGVNTYSFLHFTLISRKIFSPCSSLKRTMRMRFIILEGRIVPIQSPVACQCSFLLGSCNQS